MEHLQVQSVREDLAALQARLERGAALAKDVREKNERFLASMGWKAEAHLMSVASTTSRVGATPAAAQEDQAVPSAETVERGPSQLDEAEEAILSFWLIRGGGGAGGDAALAAALFEPRIDPLGRPVVLDGLTREAPVETLDAPQLEARLHKVLGVQLEPAHSAQLLARLLSVSACEVASDGRPTVLSAQTLQAWVRQRYRRFELEQLLQSDGVQLHKILVRHLMRENGQNIALTRDEVRDGVLAAASDIADAVYEETAKADAARKAAQTGGANGKFAGDDLGGTFEGKFASAQAFHGGLDRHVGLPNQNVLEAVISEHKYARNAATPYKTSNYGLTCTPEEELEAVLCPVPGKTYPGAGSGEHEREILRLRVFLSAAGCLRSACWSDPTRAATLKKLETMCGSLELNDEDKVHEAMSLLMMAKQGFSGTIKAVQRDLAKRCEGRSGTLNLEMFYTAMAFVTGWESATTLKHMDRGRALFHKADLWPEEVLGARLYTGPGFMHYNASLREFPQWVLDTMEGNRYVTTIHCINSAIIKLARASPLEPLVVHRGSCGMRLPVQFAAKDDLGRQGDVELGIMSCTANKNVALQYAAGGKMAMLLCFERGAMDNGAPLSALSFYKGEEEICFPPLCSIEVKGKPKILFTDKGSVLQVKMGITVNQKADTIDKLIERRQFLHEGMVKNLVQEVESELKSVDALLSTIRSLTADVAKADIVKSIAGAAEEEALVDFTEKARRTCADTLADVQDRPAAEFNNDDKYSALVKDAVDMKMKRALKKGHHYKLLGAWFAHCAKTDVRALEAVVGRLDAHMWSDKRVVDEGNGETPLLAALGAGSFEICETLIQAGADAKAADKQGKPPLVAACEVAHFKLCEALIKAGAEVNAADQRGTTPLLAACGAGSFEIFEALITAGVQVSAARHDGATALALSIMSKSRRLITLLLRPGMKLDSPQDTHDATLISTAELVRLASAYSQPFNIGTWLQDGALPLGLKGEISALMVALEVRDAEGPMAEMKLQLSHMHALLESHAVFLKDPPVPLPHAVTQLAVQGPGLVCEGPKEAKDGQPIATYDIIEITNPASALRFKIQGKGEVSSLAYSKDGKRLARGEGENVVVCCAESGFEQCHLTGHTRKVLDVAFHPTKNLVASCSADRTIKLWNTDTGAELSTLRLNGVVSSIEFAPCGTKLAAACNDISGDRDFSVQIFSKEGSTGNYVCQSHLSCDSGVSSVVWSPDGAKIAAGTGSEVVIFDSTSVAPVGSPLSGHSHLVTAVSWSPDGTKLASGSYDKTVRIWDSASGEQLCSLRGHSHWVKCVAFKPDNPNIVVSGSDDKTINVWDITSGSCLSTRNVGGPVTAVKFASEDIVASSSADGSTEFWDLGTGQEKTAEAVPEGFTFPKEGGAKEQRINSYVVAAKGKTLCIFKAADEAETAEAPKVETAAVAFFQCSSAIQAFDVSARERSHIAVGCADGQVLQLRAAVLLT